MNSQKIQGTVTTTMFLGVVWSDKMCVVLEAVFNKLQAYPTPKNAKEMQSFVEILGF